MKRLIFILLLSFSAAIFGAKEWLNSNILFNDTSEPFMVSMKVAGECESALQCYHKIDIVSVERPLDIKSVVINRHEVGSTAKIVPNDCTPDDPTDTLLEFPLTVPRTGIWYVSAQTCWASNDLCSDKVDSRVSTAALVKCTPGGWMMYKYPGKPVIGF